MARPACQSDRLPTRQLRRAWFAGRGRGSPARDAGSGHERGSRALVVSAGRSLALVASAGRWRESRARVAVAGRMSRVALPSFFEAAHEAANQATNQAADEAANQAASQAANQAAHHAATEAADRADTRQERARFAGNQFMRLPPRAHVACRGRGLQRGWPTLVASSGRGRRSRVRVAGASHGRGSYARVAFAFAFGAPRRRLHLACPSDFHLGGEGPVAGG